MDQNSNKNQNSYHPFITKTLHLLVPLSIFSFIYYIHNILHFSSLIFNHLDRKYMFLICNGILVVLAKNLKLSSSNLNYVEIAEDKVQQITELPRVLEEDAVQENAASMDDNKIVEDGVQQITELPRVLEEEAVQETAASEDYIENVAVLEEKQVELQQEMKSGDFILESEDEDENEESGGLEGILVNDARVSTEELNKKFEEFIRKMKEEIRIEARQQLIAV
ncbi:hypothetical protein CDL12_28453 [Handroanthus impetiginosus]|uniref:DUF4408 domain-containing protein n=1 Tax=Handroanthus impetiginosus TaxID=429701 RepID=A0A2G9G197_9LAMI|nr:hypothetical protein CDL12_28453 [Handroanthus impetiginosus]